MPAIERGIASIELRRDGGESFSRAILTTDRVPKYRALRFSDGGRVYTIGGTTKGAGMVHPQMATMFCFLTTDAPVASDFLQATLKAVADVSFNMIDIDMDTSTSDTMLLLANGLAGGKELDARHPVAPAFHRALERIATELAKDLVRDAEGAKTVIEAVVEGARTPDDARRAARTIASSPLVKTMVTGRDANLGRVMMAIGRSGADVDVDRTSVFIGSECAFSRGAPTTVDYGIISRAMDAPEVRIRVDMGLGPYRATAWGCDLTEEYVRINADYTT
jgi:glutamate N-acetyltransferase/amino-acid N-acetyltransferase